MPEGFSNNIKSNSVFAYVDILFQFFCKVYRIACFTTSCFYSHIYDLCKIYCTLFLQIHDLILKKVYTCLSLQNYTLCLLSIIERRISSKSLKLWIFKKKMNTKRKLIISCLRFCSPKENRCIDKQINSSCICT